MQHRNMSDCYPGIRALKSFIGTLLLLLLYIVFLSQELSHSRSVGFDVSIRGREPGHVRRATHYGPECLECALVMGEHSGRRGHFGALTVRAIC